MHQQVRIAAYGRSEMHIGIVGQSEMADIVRTVDRLTETSQHHRLDEMGVGARPHGLQQPCKVLRGWIVATAQAQPELGQEGP